MNIKSRIRKIEIETISRKAFCNCFQKFFEAIARSIYDGEPDAKITLPENDYCPKCRKSVSACDTEVVRNINEIYGVS